MNNNYNSTITNMQVILLVRHVLNFFVANLIPHNMHYYTFILSRLPCGVSINFSFNKKIVFTDEFNIMFFCLDFGLRLFIQKFEFLNFFQIFLG